MATGDVEPGDPLPRADDGARTLRADDRGEGAAVGRTALALVHVPEVDPHGCDVDQHRTVAGLGVGHLGDRQHLGAAAALHDHCLHVASLVGTGRPAWHRAARPATVTRRTPGRHARQGHPGPVDRPLFHVERGRVASL